MVMEQIYWLGVAWNEVGPRARMMVRLYVALLIFVWWATVRILSVILER